MGWWHNDRGILHTFCNIKGSIIAMAAIIFVLKTCCQIKNIRICCILNASVPWYSWLNFHAKSYIGCGVNLQGKWRSNKPKIKFVLLDLALFNFYLGALSLSFLTASSAHAVLNIPCWILTSKSLLICMLFISFFKLVHTCSLWITLDQTGLNY